MSDFCTERVPDTAISGFCSPSAATAGFSSAAFEIKVTDVFSALPKLPNIGR